MNLMTTISIIYWVSCQRKIKLFSFLDDFNVDLLNFDKHSLTNDFLDFLSSYMLLSHIVQTNKNKNNSKTLIDHIYSNAITPNNILGNITATILDHLSHFLIVPEMFYNPPIYKIKYF